MKKSKIILGIVASVLALSLAIGGTLMLFTAETAIATNVVTIGAAELKIWEQDDNGVDVIVDGTDVTGMTWENALPLDELVKKPFIENSGSVDVYTYVTARLSIDKSFSETEAAEFAQYAGLMNDWDFFQGLLGADEEWQVNFSDLTLGAWKDGAGAFELNFYYGDKVDGVIVPKVLEAGDKTNYIFTGVKVPDFTGKAAELIAGATITLELKGYAVQADNSGIETIADLTDAFTENN